MSLDAHPLVRDWLECSHGRIVVKSGKVDIGQCISTALVRIVADELTVPPAEIDVAEVRTGVSPDEGVTSGSNSIEQSGKALRAAAATWRREFLAVAAAQLGVAAAALELAGGEIGYKGINRRLRLVDLIDDLPPDLRVDLTAVVSDRASGQALAPTPPRGLEDMVTGTFLYVQDLERPEMRHARIVRPPHARARLLEIDPAVRAGLERDGFRIVQDGSFLALAGPKEWPLLRAATRLASACSWDEQGGLREGDVFQMLQDHRRTSLLVVDGQPQPGEPPPPFAAADHEAVYERPYQMHGALAPSAALAEWRGGRLTIHSHSQGIYPLRDSIAESLDLARDRVELVHVPGSGCYGHNGADDAAFEAALIALAIPETPILLRWTREEEHAWEPYAPAMRVSLAARLEEDGEITGFSAEASGDSHSRRPRPGPNQAGPARLLANHFRAEPIVPRTAEPAMGRHVGLHRNLDPSYRFAERRVVKNLVYDLPLRTSAMRCLGAAANVFAIESFMDELAAKSGQDPLDLRRRHLDDPRALAVLEAIAPYWTEKGRMGEGRGCGLAYSQYKNAATRLATMVDLSVNDRAEIHLHKVIMAADSGRIIDPDGLRAQLEGGFIQGASWTLHEEVRWNRSGVLTRDWESYPVIGFDNIPEFEIILLEPPGEPSVGAGEAASSPAIAAIANAVFAATGLRLRRLPFTADAIRQSALGDPSSR